MSRTKLTDAGRARLLEERKSLMRDKPAGMWARPRKAADGSLDLSVWDVGILPKAGSVWALPEAGTYNAELVFDGSYPAKPPACRFWPALFHPNNWPDGRVCMSLLLDEGHHAGRDGKSHWAPTISIAQIMTALAQWLEEPNPASVAHEPAATALVASRAGWEAAVRREAAGYAAKAVKAGHYAPGKTC